jgi:hypothetical protein
MGMFHGCDLRDQTVAFMAGMLLTPPQEKDDSEHENGENGEAAHNSTENCTNVVLVSGR